MQFILHRNPLFTFTLHVLSVLNTVQVIAKCTIGRSFVCDPSTTSGVWSGIKLAALPVYGAFCIWVPHSRFIILPAPLKRMAWNKCFNISWCLSMNKHLWHVLLWAKPIFIHLFFVHVYYTCKTTYQFMYWWFPINNNSCRICFITHST